MTPMGRTKPVETLPFGSAVYFRRDVYDDRGADRDKPFDWSMLSNPEYETRVVLPSEVLGTADKSSLGPFDFSSCPYCAADLVYEAPISPDGGQEWRRSDLLECGRCRWWTFVWTKCKFHPYDRMRNEVWEAAVATFDYGLSEAPLAELRRLIAEGKIDLRTVTPKELERIVTAVFRDYLGRSASHIGGARDGGIDVLILDGEPPLAIQVKRRARSQVEGPAVVRELIGALAYRGWRRGAVVTTASRFSPQAEDTAAAAALRREGYEIDLYTYDGLRDLVRAAEPSPRPWTKHVNPAFLPPTCREVPEVR